MNSKICELNILKSNWKSIVQYHIGLGLNKTIEDEIEMQKFFIP